MKRTIEIHIGEAGLLVGTLRYDQQGGRESASFEYAGAWLGHDHRFAIDPLLKLVAGPQFHRRTGGGSLFHGAIADTEPDGWARRVIQRDHAKRREKTRRTPHLPLSDLDYLLAVDDMNRPGALRMKDETGTFQRAGEPGRRTAPPLLELGQLLSASRAIESNSETAADLAYLLGRGTSLGGMRPKCSVVDEDGNLAIAKFPSVGDERAVTKGEVLALELARLAGINAAQARLISSDGVPVALISRFDRPREGGRLMYVSAQTMLDAAPDDAEAHSYIEIVDAIRRHGDSVQADIEELWRRIAFSILITNVDDHLRNHGFLHSGRDRWRLSPAFDINPFPERRRDLKTWISPGAGSSASIDALLSIAPYCRVPLKRAKEILGDVESTVAQWQKLGRKLGMTTRELQAFTPAFEHGERHVARRVCGKHA